MKEITAHTIVVIAMTAVSYFFVVNGDFSSSVFHMAVCDINWRWRTVYHYKYYVFCCSNGNASSTASVEPEVKLPAREPVATRDVEVAITGAEVGSEREVVLAAAAGEAATVTDTVTAASLLPQSVPSVSPSPAAEVSGMLIHLN